MALVLTAAEIPPMQPVFPCPRCADGGLVLLVGPIPPATVFSPLPKCERTTVMADQCSKCRWMLEVRDVKLRKEQRPAASLLDARNQPPQFVCFVLAKGV
jgi:hypothetical protein